MQTQAPLASAGKTRVHLLNSDLQPISVEKRPLLVGNHPPYRRPIPWLLNEVRISFEPCRHDGDDLKDVSALERLRPQSDHGRCKLSELGAVGGVNIHGRPRLMVAVVNA